MIYKPVKSFATNIVSVPIGTTVNTPVKPVTGTKNPETPKQPGASPLPFKGPGGVPNPGPIKFGPATTTGPKKGSPVGWSAPKNLPQGPGSTKKSGTPPTSQPTGPNKPQPVPTAPGTKSQGGNFNPTQPMGPARPTAPSRRGANASGSGGARSGAPSSPRGPGLDWHYWWAFQRVLWWPTHRATATRSARAGGVEADTAWVDRLAKFLDKPWGRKERLVVARTVGYGASPAMLPVALQVASDADDEIGADGVFAAVVCQDDAATALQVYVNLLLDRGSPERRRAKAAQALGYIGDPAATPVLRRTLRNRHIHWRIRSGAAQGLGYLGDEGAVADISRVAADRSARHELRVDCAASLGMIAREGLDNGAANEALRKLLSRPSVRSARLRQTVLLALGRGQVSHASVKTLISALKREPSQAGRACAAIGLGWASNPQSSLPADVKAGRKTLRDRWKHEPPSVRAMLSLALALSGDTGSRTWIERKLRRASDPILRGALAVSLGMLGERSAVAAIAPVAVGSGSPGMRADCAEALGMLGGPDAIAALRQLARSGSPEVRGAALYGLGLASSGGDYERIVRGLDAGTPLVRQGAIFGLAANGGSSARDALLAHATDEAIPGLRQLSIASVGLAIAQRPVPKLFRQAETTPFETR